MRNAFVGSTCILATSVALAACKPPGTYSYQYHLTKSLDASFNVDEAHAPPTAEARTFLATARTVAFYPPSNCVGSVGKDTGQDRMLRANCGVLLSSLERAAHSAGFQVVSWQNLQGPDRPIQYAREANVDVLFEINEFALTFLDDSTVKRAMEFKQREGDEPERPLQVSRDVALRCKNYAIAHDPVAAAQLKGTIDIKTVAVSDARNRWSYRKTTATMIDRQYPKVSFSARPRPSKLGRVLASLGAVGLGVGGGLWLGSALTPDDPLTPENEKLDLSEFYQPLMIGGGVLLLAGAVLSATSGSLPPPEEVMCSTAFAPIAEVSAAPVSTGSSSSTYDFNDTVVSSAHERESERIRDHMVDEFVKILIAVKSDPAPRATP